MSTDNRWLKNTVDLSEAEVEVLRSLTAAGLAEFLDKFRTRRCTNRFVMQHVRLTFTGVSDPGKSMFLDLNCMADSWLVFGTPRGNARAPQLLASTTSARDTPAVAAAFTRYWQGVPEPRFNVTVSTYTT